jgi:hypothetical protein
VFLSLVALCVWQGVLARYSYGLFKVLFLAVWWVAPMMAVGIEYVMEVLNSRVRTVGVVAVAVGVVVFAGAVRVRSGWDQPWRGAPCISAERELEEVEHVLTGAPVVLAMSNAFEYQWAVYYLRNVGLLTPAPIGYLAMPHVIGFVKDARRVEPVGKTIMLVSGRRENAVWSNGAFSAAVAGSAEILGVASPNGVETVQNDRFFWLGREPARLTIQAAQAGLAQLRAKEFWLGPSAPGITARTIVSECGQRRLEYRFTGASKGIPLQLDIGTQECRVWCTDLPSVTRQANGDTRVLLLGVKGFYIADTESAR